VGRRVSRAVTEHGPTPQPDAPLFEAVVPGRKPFGRAADVVLAAGLLLLLSPLFLLVALAVRLTSRGPVFFRQERAGRGGRVFELLKFRTMYANNDDSAHRALCLQELERPDAPALTTDGLYKLENDPRITRVGRPLRRWSVDELPQLVNVLRGEMAIVGPRPLPTWEVAAIPQQLQQRDCVLPGLTGLWQVRGRNRLSTFQMLELDVEYVRRRSWKLDLEIIARTPAALIRGDGAR
jgi:lipopolysaccharide/colanic/teichoic acid biosynthesis glycosyltransferase